MPTQTIQDLRKAPPMGKIQHLASLLDTNIPKQDILKTHIPEIGLHVHSAILIEIKKITSLPNAVQEFCKEKNLSYKQCLNLAHIPHDILNTVSEWQTTLPITTSNFIKFTQMLRDICKRENTTIRDLIKTNKLKKENMKKINLITLNLHELCYPIQTQTNMKIETQIKDLNLPKNIEITWDKTLENKGLTLKVEIRSPQDMKDLTEKLKNSQIQEKLLQALDKT